jgi:GTP cyclohydrolase I
MQTERILKAVRELLIAIGEDPDRQELAQTPQKVAEAYASFFRGIGQNPADALKQTMDAAGSELVMLRDIELVSICEHHLLPFTGVAHIAYLPDKKIVGLGRLANLVEILSARAQLQENLTNQIADQIEKSLSPKGVLVVIEARHQCVASRGARQPEVNTITLASRGSYSDVNNRQEAMQLLSVSK